jgi:hypothetical protein
MSISKFFITACVVAIFAIGGLLAAKYVNLSNQQVFLAKAVPAPIPTEINANFIKQVNECFLPTAAVYGYTLRITSGFRSVADQEQTYSEGRTVDGHIVTWAEPGKSLHNYGYAVDVVDRWRGYNVNWKKLAKIGAYCGLEQVDDPHFEHRGGLATADFAAGMRPPPLTLPCAIMDQKFQVNAGLTLADLKSCNAPPF